MAAIISVITLIRWERRTALTTPNFGTADIETLRHAPEQHRLDSLSCSNLGRVVVGFGLYGVKIKALRAFATFLSEVLR
jgi:hypothetical protein